MSSSPPAPILVATEPRDEADDALLEARTRAALSGARIELLRPADDSPHEQLLQRARESGAQLIVLPAGHERLSITSTAGRVIRHAPCPVLIARASAVHGPVVGATDLSVPSLPALRAARTEAELLGLPMIAVHVVPPVAPVISTGDSIGLAAFERGALAEVAETARRELDRAIEEVAPRAQSALLDGPPAAMIVDYAERVRARLVCVASHGRTGIGRLLIGSTAEEVARRAPCSVLVVPVAANG